MKSQARLFYQDGREVLGTDGTINLDGRLSQTNQFVQFLNFCEGLKNVKPGIDRTYYHLYDDRRFLGKIHVKPLEKVTYIILMKGKEVGKRDFYEYHGMSTATKKKAMANALYANEIPYEVDFDNRKINLQ